LPIVRKGKEPKPMGQRERDHRAVAAQAEAGDTRDNEWPDGHPDATTGSGS
jgi:hypothetical protein